jgi:hypothetical protein
LTDLGVLKEELEEIEKTSNHSSSSSVKLSFRLLTVLPIEQEVIDILRDRLGETTAEVAELRGALTNSENSNAASQKRVASLSQDLRLSGVLKHFLIILSVLYIRRYSEGSTFGVVKSRSEKCR